VTHVGYLVAGYGLTSAVLVGYVLRLRSRGRALARSTATPPSGRDRAARTAAQADAPTP
jgi:hypothetical protein